MLTAGSLLYFNPFIFKNGAPSKPKYFVVLAVKENGSVLLASLPTSKDHIPADVVPVRGCVNIPESSINAFVFEKGDQVTDAFCFPKRTFIYGEQIDFYTHDYLDSMSTLMTNLGSMKSDLFKALKECLKQATNVGRKYQKWL